MCPFGDVESSLPCFGSWRYTFRVYSSSFASTPTTIGLVDRGNPGCLICCLGALDGCPEPRRASAPTLDLKEIDLLLGLGLRAWCDLPVLVPHQRLDRRGVTQIQVQPWLSSIPSRRRLPQLTILPLRRIHRTLRELVKSSSLTLVCE